MKLVFAGLFFSFQLFANEQNQPIKGGSAMDFLSPESFKKAPPTAANDPSKSNLKFTGFTCKNDQGVELKSSDVGYQECLNKSAEKNNTKN